MIRLVLPIISCLLDAFPLSSYYINYKMMKRKMKTYLQVQGTNEEEQALIRKQFARLLDWQIEKTVLFLLEQQGHLAARLRVLGEEREAAKERMDSRQISGLVDAYRMVGLELLKLLEFVQINATGIRKILKKFDKRAAYKLTDYYVASRANHPYSQLQQVFRHVGIGAMVGAITRSLGELKDETKSLYDEPAGFHVGDPIVQSLKAAQERLTNSTTFLKFMAKAVQFDKEDEIPSVADDVIVQQYHVLSLLLNLGSTFLYMVNTYIIVPSADKYAYSLGAAPTLCGVIIGSMAVAQLGSSIYFSAWSNKSYFRPLVFSSIVLLVGNVLYALAYNFNSLTVLILGRLFCGLGSARAVNRRYISDWVPLKKRLQASAGFVSASAVGMAVGPALAGLFEINKSFFSITLNSSTLPGWVMAVSWLVYLLLLWVGFKEPLRNDDITDSSSHLVKPGNLHARNHALTHPLLDHSKNANSINHEDPGNESGSDFEKSKRPATSLVEAYKLLTMPVKVQLFIYFMLKYAMEILLSESSVVTAYYFDWSTRSVALFLALLGLTVLPVNYLVGSYLSNMFEDRQILFASELITCLGIMVCFVGPVPYTVPQYVSGVLITFVAAEVLEGVNLSLLSKVMSERLARGTYNNGLLSTEAGTLARVVADGTITLAGYLGTGLLLNVTLTPTLLIGILSLIATFYSYNSLF
ncbi:hypothetical protein KP509_04G003900 [Ceratopteris richardii]|uniref:SPX domain-containing protein n=3 Tax=Ceratopteris richardii TaxID=49495 RepID=A0A8T2US73_CERRI|nr:hypothetical protein KP509_04G003900 [Ceratopteris richardii]